MDLLPSKKRILKLEEVIFNNSYSFFGDKGIFNPGAKLLHENNLDFILIIIYRDPRDVVSSVVRQYPSSHFGYNSNDPNVIYRIWSEWLTEMITIGNDYATKSLIIRFEDYIENPGLNGTKINSF